ncbi:Hypothetical protein Achr_11310 [Azotobacter chroococcum NCIMB 8003]|uniref:DUF7281 domain-containing protein n=1 Tax=Azotobacter chroococcum NCIMB 8003 TaxID=1328314 RepID=A0A0C4WQR6_9GAMM|nr:Hypothetical protein Achr_11310 [Azotobacter chroococcum NCIMB 8003]
MNATWQRIHRDLEVGEVRENGKLLHFSARERDALRQLAEQSWGFDLLVEAVPPGSRAQVAAISRDEKIARQRPDDGFVLLKGRLPAPLPALPPGLSLRVPLESLDLSATAQVLVIENLDSFDDWERYRAPARLTDSLVLYRGHGGLARGARRLLATLPERCEVTVFADYDPAGLSIAASLPRADTLLAPELDERLLEKGSREHFARQSRQSAHLEGIGLDDWQGVWEEMKAHQVSIKQQHMLALGTVLRQVPRR